MVVRAAGEAPWRVASVPGSHNFVLFDSALFDFALFNPVLCNSASRDSDSPGVCESAVMDGAPRGVRGGRGSRDFVARLRGE